MTNPIQTSFAYHQQIGQVGAIARPNAPHDIDLGVAGVEILPGQGVYYDAGTDAWILPVSAATRKLVTHVVSFNSNAYNTDIAVPTTNNASRVVYAAGDLMPLVSFGSVFVLAGETVESEDSAIYNETTEKWIKYTPASATPNDLRKTPFKFYLPPNKTAADGEIVEIKVPSPNYSFATLGAYTAETIKVSLTAAEVKVLRATPFELVAAQGANTLIQFISAVFVLTYGSEVFTESADNLAVEYDDGSGVTASAAIETTGFIDAAEDTMTTALAVIDAIDATADVVNKNIALANTGDGEIAGNASDDSTLDVYVTYRVLDLS